MRLLLGLCLLFFVGITRVQSAGAQPFEPAPAPGASERPDLGSVGSTSTVDDADRLGTDLMGSVGLSLLIGWAWGGHYFEDNPNLPNYYAGNSSDTSLEDDGRDYVVLRLNSPEYYFSFDGSKYPVPVRFGYRFVFSGSSFTANRKFGAELNEDGHTPKSRFSVNSQYAYAAPQLVARFWSPQPAQGFGAAIAYGMGLGYSKFSGRLENTKNPDGPARRVNESGFGLADLFFIEVHYTQWMFFFEAELVHLARSGRYYSSGFGTVGVAYLWVF